MSRSGGPGIDRNQPPSSGPPQHHNTICLRKGHSGAAQNEVCNAASTRSSCAFCEDGARMRGYFTLQCTAWMLCAFIMNTSSRVHLKYYYIRIAVSCWIYSICSMCMFAALLFACRLWECWSDNNNGARWYDISIWDRTTIHFPTSEMILMPGRERREVGNNQFICMLPAYDLRTTWLCPGNAALLIDLIWPQKNVLELSPNSCLVGLKAVFLRH